MANPFQTLLELVQTGRLDPWDVDLEKLSEVYFKRLEPDLRLAGRALLSASVLLKLKSDWAVNGYDGKENPEVEEPAELILPELGPLALIRPALKRITLADLLGALQDALREAPVQKPPSRQAERVFKPLSEFKVNIQKHLQELHRRIAALAERGKLVTLRGLVGKPTRIALARTLLLLLFLGAQGKVRLEQEEPFGEIRVLLLKPPGGLSGG